MSGSRSDAGLMTSIPADSANCATGEDCIALPLPTRASGRVMTAATSWRESRRRRRETAATSGVPAKTQRTCYIQREEIVCGLILTAGAGSPNHSASRI